MAKKPTPNPEALLKGLTEIFVPKQYLEYFELYELKDKPECYELILHEKEHLLPSELQGKEAVLDGFCNPISILANTVLFKRVYLLIKRRRWKEVGQEVHYNNTYDLHPDGAKLSPQFVAFLKAVDRAFPREH